MSSVKTKSLRLRVEVCNFPAHFSIVAAVEFLKNSRSIVSSSSSAYLGPLQDEVSFNGLRLSGNFVLMIAGL